MKNLIKFSIVMVVLCITACTQTFENTSNEVQKKAQGRLVMKVGNESRTIKPTIGESDVKTAVLTANGNEIKSWSGDNIISQIENTEDILLDVGNYDFTMTFRNAGNIDILTATISLKIDAGDNFLDFKMKPVTTGTGDISITLTWDDPSEIYTITAGLYDIANNTPVEGFADSALEITSTEEQTPIATYSKTGVPVGQYIIKFKSYKDNILLNTSTDVIKVAAGITTSTQITLSKINRQYTISYNLNAGNWVDGFIKTEYRNGNKKIVLPTAEKIIRDGYKFDGWYDDDNNKITEIASDTMENIYVTAKWLQLYTITYYLNGGINAESNPTSYTVETETITLDIPTKNDTNSTFLGWYNESGDKITEIKPSETAANITVTASWRTTCTADNVCEVIASLSGTAPHDILVTEEMNSDFIANYIKPALADALKENQNIKVNLDLSKTTEMDKITGWAFEGMSGLSSVILPDSVTSIGDTAFRNCSNLTSINIPYGVTSIETNTFTGCSSLTEITIPDSVTLIGESAFEGCSNLTSVTIPDSVTTIGSSAFNGCSNLASVTIPDSVATISSHAFYGCGLRSVTIPDSVKEIGGSAFGYCGSLTSVTIPDGVTTIGSYAFRHCSSLESVTIGKNVTSIADYAFWYCGKLTSVIILDSVTSIAYNAFNNCYSVKTLVTGNGLESLDNLPITSALESITIGDSITEIGDNKFKDFTNLKSVTFAENSKLTTIGEFAFENCSNLTSIIIPDGVTTIKWGMFKNCNSVKTLVTGNGLTSLENLPITNALESIIIGNSITEIGENKFKDLTNLKSVTIGSSVTTINASAFCSCSNLTAFIVQNSNFSTLENGKILCDGNGEKLISYPSASSSVTIPYGITTIGDYAFAGCSDLTSVTIGSSVTTINASAFCSCSNLTEFIVQNSNFSTLESGKILCDGNGKKLISYPSASGSVTIPEGIATIGDYAFENCTSLTEITIPNSVEIIGRNAFVRTVLTSVVLPDSITEMGINVFWECSNLETVTLSNSITSIPNSTFFMCHKLSEIVIPEGVISIEYDAFCRCSSLTSIVIPASVTSIVRGAFFYSGLTTVNYRGTEENWNLISIDSTYNDALINATKTYNYTEE